MARPLQVDSNALMARAVTAFQIPALHGDAITVAVTPMGAPSQKSL